MLARGVELGRVRGSGLLRAKRPSACGGRRAGPRGVGAGLGRERGIGMEERSAGWAKETRFVG